jgi:predicted ATPase
MAALLLCNIAVTAKDRIIGLTGGPGVGKSSVIEILQKQGVQVVPETFTTLFNHAKAENTLDAFFADPVKLRYNLMNHQIKMEDARDKSKITLVDETALGVLFFGNLWNVPMSQDLYETAENRRYDMIFMFDPLPKQFYKQTEVRRETSEESKKTHDFLKKKYQETGLFVVDVPFGTPEHRAEFILDTIEKRYHYSDVIPDVFNCFAGKNTKYMIKEFFGPIKLIEVPSKTKIPYRFFGVHQNELKKIGAQDLAEVKIFFAQFKSKITRLMGVKKNNAMQLIGDSNQFTREGTEWAREFLKRRFAQAGLIEYGFTGYKTAYKSDVNTFVNEYLDQNPSQAYRVLANIVGHTVMALNQWGTSGSPYVRNFVVVYNDAGAVDLPKYNDKFEKVAGFTTFGDDIIISDFFFNPADNDRFVCLEGGAQSFKQATNALIIGVPVICVYNLRKPENEQFFSAARFFKLINDAYANGNEPTKEDVKRIYDSYVKTLTSLWDARRPDYETKKALFEIAIKQFIDQGIYEKIPSICDFRNAKVDKPV